MSVASCVHTVLSVATSSATVCAGLGYRGISLAIASINRSNPQARLFINAVSAFLACLTRDHIRTAHPRETSTAQMHAEAHAEPWPSARGHCTTVEDRRCPRGVSRPDVRRACAVAERGEGSELNGKHCTLYHCARGGGPPSRHLGSLFGGRGQGWHQWVEDGAFMTV